MLNRVCHFKDIHKLSFPALLLQANIRNPDLQLKTTSSTFITIRRIFRTSAKKDSSTILFPLSAAILCQFLWNLGQLWFFNIVEYCRIRLRFWQWSCRLRLRRIRFCVTVPQMPNFQFQKFHSVALKKHRHALQMKKFGYNTVLLISLQNRTECHSCHTSNYVDEGLRKRNPESCQNSINTKKNKNAFQ